MSFILKEPRKIVVDLSKQADYGSSSTSPTSNGATTQKVIVIDEPFHQIRMTEATDANSYVTVIFGEFFQGKLGQNLYNRDSIRSGYFIDMNPTRKFQKAHILITAQAGKSCNLWLHYEDEFSSGQTLANNTVTNSLPTTRTVTNPVVTINTPSVAFAANAAARKRKIINNSGSDIYIGTVNVSNTGANRGELLPTNQVWEEESTSAVYVFNTVGWAANSDKMTCVELS